MGTTTNYIGLRPIVEQALAKYGVIGDVKFVGNASGTLAGYGEFDTPYATLAAALADADLGPGDAVVCLPGHSESVADATMLDNLDDGVAIIGIGHGTNRPTFRWTAAGSQWALNNANTIVAGLRLRLEGANGVTKAIDITGAGVTLDDNHIQVASGASNKATIAIEVGSAATDCTISRNWVYGTATHNVTDGIKVVGGTVPSRLRIFDNEMVASATAANGLIHVTVAALEMVIRDNIIYNTHTSSTACIVFDNVACDGIVVRNYLGTKNDGTASAQGITFGAGALVVCGENYSIDEAKKSAVLAPAAAAT